MPSQDKFRDLYHDQMEPLLRKHEGFRKSVLSAQLLGLVLLLIVVFNGESFSALTSMLLIGAAVLSCTYGFYHYQDYRRDYKKKINGKMIKLINPTYKYFYERYFDLRTVLNSGIYYIKPDSVTGDDFVAGKVGTIPFEFCELNTHNAVVKYPLFKGLFFKIGLDRALAARVFVFPDSHGKFRQNNQRNLQKQLGNWIELSEEFNAHFSVFCIDEGVAKRLIGPHMQKALLSLKKELHKDLHVAFHENLIYCSVTYDEKLFEPKVFHKGPQPGDIMQSFELFTVVDKIVDHLALTEEQVKEDAVSYVSIVAEPQEELFQNIEVVTPSAATDPIIGEIEVPKISDPITPAIDYTLDLEALLVSISGFKESKPERALQIYLQALYKNLLAHGESLPTQATLAQLLSDSFTSEPQPIDEAWLAILRSPDVKVLQAVTEQTDEVHMDFTLAVIKFQIAELDKMKGKQLDNTMRDYGVASETGTPWYNFTIYDNLNSGIEQLIKDSEAPQKASWSLIGRIMQLGRVNG